MSCFICSDDHFRELAAFVADHVPDSDLFRFSKYELNFPVTPKDKVMLGQWIFTILHNENVRSYNTRYTEDIEFVEVHKAPFTLNDIMNREVRDPVRIAGMLNCYDYQACENEDYHESHAYQIVQKIRELCLDELISSRDDKLGHSDVPWEFTSKRKRSQESEIISLSSMMSGQ